MRCQISLIFILTVSIISLLFDKVNSFIQLTSLSNRYNTILQAKEGLGSGIYEYKGPSGGNGPPAEIAAMFDLSKGRKIKKGKSNYKTNSKGTGKPKTIETISYNDNAHINSLEKDLISKYGSKALKESVLDKVDPEDVFVKLPPRGKSNQRFEGFARPAGSIGKDISYKPSKKGHELSLENKPIARSVLRPITSTTNNNNLDSEQRVLPNRPDSEPTSPLRSSSSNGKGLRIPFFKDDVFEEEEEGQNYDDDEYDFDIYDDEDDDEEEEEEYNIKKKSVSKSKTTAAAPVSERRSILTTTKSDPTTTTTTTINSRTRSSSSSTPTYDLSDVIINTPPPQPTFRLRSPAPLTPQQIQQTENKQKREIAAAENRKIQSKAKKEAEKNDYYPFEFQNNNPSIITEEVNNKLFSTLSFTDLGISNSIILSNLERMNIATPTRIQELSLPILLTGKSDVVMQAHTGSGKVCLYAYIGILSMYTVAVLYPCIRVCCTCVYFVYTICCIYTSMLLVLCIHVLIIHMYNVYTILLYTM